MCGRNGERARFQISQRIMRKLTTLLADYGRLEELITYVKYSHVLE